VHDSCARLNHADHLIARIVDKDVALRINRYQLRPIQLILGVGSVNMARISTYARKSCHVSLLDAYTPYAVVICVGDVGDSRLSILRVFPLFIFGGHGYVFDSFVVQNILRVLIDDHPARIESFEFEEEVLIEIGEVASIPINAVDPFVPQVRAITY